MKKCSKCGEIKCLDNFYLRKRSSGSSVPQSHCKECQKLTRYAWVKAHPENVREINKRFEQKNPRKREWRRSATARSAAQKKYYQTEKGKQKQRRRGIKERRDLTNAYVKALLKGKDHQLVVTDEMIVMKREQLILHRLTKELKQEIINQLENENGN